MTYYNPMSEEFKNECKKLGLTGRQLILKYQKEGKSLEKRIYKGVRSRPRQYAKYTDEELLDYLTRFYEEYGKPPGVMDFVYNPGYPNVMTYIRRFGSFQKALKLVGLDVDSIIEKGVIVTSDQKARFSEILIRDHFKIHPTDLAGENKKSPCDGICPNGMTYDVKTSSKLHGKYYQFKTDNKHKEDIELYYLLGFNEDFTELDYGWRVPGEIIEDPMLYVGASWARSKFTIKNMGEYEITDKLKDILGKYEKLEVFKKKLGL